MDTHVSLLSSLCLGSLSGRNAGDRCAREADLRGRLIGRPCVGAHLLSQQLERGSCDDHQSEGRKVNRNVLRRGGTPVNTRTTDIDEESDRHGRRTRVHAGTSLSVSPCQVAFEPLTLTTHIHTDTHSYTHTQPHSHISSRFYNCCNRFFIIGWVASPDLYDPQSATLIAPYQLLMN